MSASTLKQLLLLQRMRSGAKANRSIHSFLRKVFIMSKNISKRRGQGLVEYIIIVASVALISLVALSVFGHKVADQYAIGAGMLPGAHTEDNQAIVTGFYADVDTTGGTTSANGEVSWADITGNGTVGEMDNNVVTDTTNGNGADAFVGE